MRHAPNPITLLSGGFIALMTALALIGPVLGNGADLSLSGVALQAPDASHWFGTDELGRSVGWQLVYGSRTSLMVGVTAALSATLIGILIGAVSAYGGTRVDTVIMRGTEFFQVMPSFILAAVIVSLWGPGLSRVTLVIALLSWPQVARLMRGEVLRVRSMGFVDAARCLGLSDRAILWREIVPNAITPIITVAALIVSQAILLEAGLSYFGLSSPDDASWGKMLNSGQRFVYQAWWLSVFPGALIFLTVLSFNLLGDQLAEALNPRARS